MISKISFFALYRKDCGKNIISKVDPFNLISLYYIMNFSTIVQWLLEKIYSNFMCIRCMYLYAPWACSAPVSQQRVLGSFGTGVI